MIPFEGDKDPDQQRLYVLSNISENNNSPFSQKNRVVIKQYRWIKDTKRNYIRIFRQTLHLRWFGHPFDIDQ